MTKAPLHFFALSLVAVMSAAPLHAQTQYTWTGLEDVQTNRLDRNGLGSHYLAAPKAVPDFTNPPAGTEFLFATFSFVNPFDAPAGFFVENLAVVMTGVSGVHLVAYLGSYDPFSLGTNYLGDSGYSCHGPGCADEGLSNFSVLAPANATIELVAVHLYDKTAVEGFFEFDAFFADPQAVVPEPSTHVLLGAGLMLLAFAARRHVRTAA